MKLEITAFVDNDFNYIEEYLKIQRPIAQAIDFLQGENNIYFGFLIPTLATIRNQLRVLKNNITFKILPQNLIELTEKSLVKRFEPYFELSSKVDFAIIASALCPSVKMNWLTSLKPSITDTETEIINKRIKNKIDAEVEDESIEVIVSQPEIKYFNFAFNGKHMSYFFSIYIIIILFVENMQTNRASEYLTYLMDSSTSLEILNRYPKIKKLFTKYNTPLPSSAPVERIFSYAGLIHAPRRSSMSDKTFEELILLKVNSKFS